MLRWVDDDMGGGDVVMRGAGQGPAPRFAVLVIDDRGERRAALIERLVRGGMTPFAPRTALEAVELLTRAPLHVSLCLLAPGLGVASSRELAAVLADSFPWLTTAEITDDLDVTVARAVDARDRTRAASVGGAREARGLPPGG